MTRARLCGDAGCNGAVPAPPTAVYRAAVMSCQRQRARSRRRASTRLGLRRPGATWVA